jgi:glutamine synthetase
VTVPGESRTSPLAFTGNKLEFRMPGAPVSTAGPNIILNTTVAESLRCFADELSGADNFEAALNDLIRDTIKRHKRVIFNGNSYSADWLKEAAARGLVNLPTTADAVPCYLMDKNVELFERHGVFTRLEIESRCYIKLTEYCKKTNIEALTMIEMVRREIMPAVFRYMKDLSGLIMSKRELSVAAGPELTELNRLSELTEKTEAAVSRLEALAPQIAEKNDPRERALFCKDEILPCMDELRESADALETLTGKTYWPYPTYGKLLFDI